MNFLYCCQGHVWGGDFTRAICPHCGRRPYGMVELAPYRGIVRTQVEPQLVRSVIKHGTWDGYGLWRMVWVLLGELLELATALARRDMDGPHGIKAEAVQVAVVCIKMVERLSRSEEVPA